MSVFEKGYSQRALELAYPNVAIEKPTSFTDNIGAAWDVNRHNDISGAYESNLERAYDARRKVIKDLTGEDPGNPYYRDLGRETLERQVGPVADFLGSMFGGGTAEEKREQAIREYDERVARLLEGLPEDQRHLVKSREQIQKEIEEEAKRLEARNADIAARGGLGGLAGQMLGSMGAQMSTPEQIATLPLGAPGKMGIAMRILTEAAIGAGVEAALQPSVQAGRAAMDLESGFAKAAENVAMAGAGGAVFAGGIEAARAIIRGGNAMFRRQFGRPPTKTEEAALETARQALEVEAMTPFEASGKATAAIHQKNQEIAAKAALELRPLTPGEIEGAEIPKRAPAPPEGSQLNILRGEELAKVEVDADLMQFKAGGDEYGVTERLQGVKTWNPDYAGVMMIYEYSDGRRIVADGHQRLGLAKRLYAQGQDVQASAIILRQADGITPEMARARAAYKNMAEGSGSAVDAAKILRDAGASLEDLDLPPKSAMLRDAEGLSALNDDVFGMVVNEVLPDRFAAAIGRMVRDELRQTDIAGLLVRLKPATIFEAEQIVDQARRAPAIEGKQASLFGEEDISESLYLERARVLERAQKLLRQDAATFRTLIARGDEIADAGNVLDQAANAARLEDDQKVMQFVRSLANRKGPIADALTDAATAAKSDGNFAAAARSFLETVSRRIDDPEVIGAAGRGDRGDAEFTVEDAPDPSATVNLEPDENTLNLFDDPDSPAVQERTARIEDEIRAAADDAAAGFALPEIGAPVHTIRRPFDQVQRILAEFKARAPERSIEESYIVLPEHQKALEKVGKSLGRRKGVTFKSPGLKAIDGAREKMVRKGYKSTRELTDLVRAGFEVETPAQANAIVDRLAKQFRVLDEGWSANGELYFDRKVLVQFDDGTIGEIQIWNPKLLEAKNNGGHQLYEQSRALPKEAKKERARLSKAMRDHYGAAIDQLSDDWLEEVWVSSAANGGNAGTLAKIWANTRSETGVPELRTSASDAGSQADPPAGTKNASPSDTTAGRPSQLKNDTDASIEGTPHVDTTYIEGRAPGAQGLEVEPGAEGLPQTLLPGVAPVRDADRLALEAGRSLDGSRDPDVDFGLFGDQSAQQDLMDMLRSEGNDIRKMEIPLGETLDADGNLVPDVQTLGQVLDDIAADDEFLRQLDVCDRSAS